MRVSLIYLAAGNSCRFGSNKLLYPLKGRPMYLHLLERLVRICARHPGWNVIVVTQYPEIMEAVEKMKYGTVPEGEEFYQPVRAVFSGESVKGAAWSVRAGIRAMSEQEDVEACTFFVADQPYFSEKTAEEFLEYMERIGGKLGCVCCGEQRGNPAWFAKEYFEELMLLEGDQGGRKVLRAHPDDVELFEIGDPGEMEDLDIPPGNV